MPKRRRLYRGAPRAAKCRCGGQFARRSEGTRKGYLPTGEQYEYVLSVADSCARCGRKAGAR